jgi:hypothetical protein
MQRIFNERNDPNLPDFGEKKKPFFFILSYLACNQM